MTLRYADGLSGADPRDRGRRGADHARAALGAEV